MQIPRGYKVAVLFQGEKRFVPSTYEDFLPLASNPLQGFHTSRILPLLPESGEGALLSCYGTPCTAVFSRIFHIAPIAAR